MLLGDELARLGLSDAGLSDIEDLVSPIGLWVRNTIIHFGMGFSIYMLSVFRPRTFNSETVVMFYLLFVAVQIIQLWSPGHLLVLVADGFIDTLAVIVGYVTALWITGCDVPAPDGADR